MGKKQHQKDKLYLTANEWSTFYGGKKDDKTGNGFKKLPFFCCSLSLQPFESPLATQEGVVFDLLHIVPYVKKYGVSPVTGQPINMKDLIKLNYHKNADGKYHCPVTYKIFNENSHIVAVRTTGNVYSFEAIDRLNLKTHNLRDLLTDEKFTRADLMTLQDPEHPEKWDISTFYHVKHKLDATADDRPKSASTVRQMNPETRATMDLLAEEFPNKCDEQKKVATDSTSLHVCGSSKKAHYSTGSVSTGFTSTVMQPQTTIEADIVDHDTLLYQMVNKKGYVRLHTSVGDINLELHCDIVSATCHNFIQLCRRGYYNDTIFHRSIKNFMIQGGDPSGTGKGGQSIWKKPFKDEFKPNLSHTGRGVLSMANSGPNTNKSQFFITYRSCRHLDGKHTVFGRVVGGIEVLSEMEIIPTDSNDKPVDTIGITKATVFIDPYEEAELKLIEDAKTVSEANVKASITKTDTATATMTGNFKIGKYIASEAHKRTLPSSSEDMIRHKKAKH